MKCVDCSKEASYQMEIHTGNIYSGYVFLCKQHYKEFQKEAE